MSAVFSGQLCFIFFCSVLFSFLIKQAIEYLKSYHEWKSIISPHVRLSRFQNLEKFFLLESAIMGFAIWNSAQWIRNIANDWNPEFKFHWQGIRPLESKIQDCSGFIGIGRKIVLKIQWWIERRGPGGPHPVTFRPKWGPKGQNNFFGDRAPTLSQSLDDRSPPPARPLYWRSGSTTEI